jgi:SAM-dependent methyltransferase
VPLTRFLNKKGTYDGFDIVKKEIDWCNKHISPKYPNFSFRFTGSFVTLNNTSHKTNAENFVFPFDDERFDFVFFNSVFTHIMPAEVEQYINETGRVMKSGATSLMFFYIVNCESEDLMIKRPTQMNFPYNKGFYRLRSLQSENQHIAYDEEWLLEKLSAAGLKMESIKYGQWCGRANYLDYQDLILCRKTQCKLPDRTIL